MVRKSRIRGEGADPASSDAGSVSFVDGSGSSTHSGGPTRTLREEVDGSVDGGDGSVDVSGDGSVSFVAGSGSSWIRAIQHYLVRSGFAGP